MTTDTVGRPRIEIDFDTLIKLCELHCTQEEICDFLQVDDETLTSRLKERGFDNFSKFYKKHTGSGKISLRRLQWRSAESGNVPMQIWLGKQVLGQRDKVETENTNIALPVLPIEVLNTQDK